MNLSDQVSEIVSEPKDSPDLPGTRPSDLWPDLSLFEACEAEEARLADIEERLAILEKQGQK